jgi:putative tryptophan/tyrosine transport system substrate-binding protein
LLEPADTRFSGVPRSAIPGQNLLCCAAHMVLGDGERQMRRRDFITLAGSAAVSAPLAARAQQRPMPVIGWLSSRSAATEALVLPAFRKALNAQGYVEGRNVTVEYRYADGHDDRLPALAADLARRQAAVIVEVGSSSAGTRAVQAVSTTIPIVTIFGSDPVDAGFVASINRPGGNVTGAVSMLGLLGAKRLGLVHDLLPRATTIAVLMGGQNDAAQETDVQEAARVLGLRTEILNARTEPELDAAFATLARMRPDTLFVATAPFLFTHADQIIAAAARLALPASYFRREFVAAGGLMSYGSNTKETYGVLGNYTGRILKGEKPADLPIQWPVKFELVLNLKTAKALGLAVPTSMLLLADEVIE